MKLGKVDLAIAAALWIGCVIVLVETVGTLGYARDEGFYFHAASSYGKWFEALVASPSAAMDRKAIDAAWSYNHEHPAFLKSLFALSNLVLQKRLHLFAMEGTSFRFPAMVLSGGLVALVYAWGAEARSRTCGLAAAAAIAAMPRVFFHAHLACFDVPIVALWTLCAYTFWKSLRAGGWRWPLLVGLTFGLALNSKHNSWFLPIVTGAHTAITIAIARLAGGDAWKAARPQIGRAIASLAAMAALGPVIFVGMWPWIWHDTLPRLREYGLFHLNHEYYNMEFFGVSYWEPPMPRTYAFVMTAATVPGVTLLLFALGLFGRLRLRIGEGARFFFGDAKEASIAARALAFVRRWIGAPRLGSAIARRGPTPDTELLWLLSIGAIYAAWLSPKTPIFGGTKHWMTAYPFVALFAGVGFDDAIRAVRSQLQRWRGRIPGARRIAKTPYVAAVIGALTMASPIVQTARSHPWGLTAYTPLVGGAAGAATLGLNRTFWGYQTGAVTDFLNASPKGTTVFLHDTLPGSWDMLVTDGRVRKDIRATMSVDASTLALYQHEKHMGGVEYQTWIAYETCRPAHVAGLDGVPVIWVYERPKK
ncbi:MAG: glycosyltransferase family 39 protein [Polyangiaceae bacterium]